MNTFLLIFFICGWLLSIVGWFFDRASRFTWLMRLVTRDSFHGLNSLDLLAENPSFEIIPEHPGFHVILERWPDLADKNSVAIIGRGAAYMKFGAQVTPGFALVALDKDKNKIGAWEEPFARKILLKEQDKMLFKTGTIIFYIGISIALISGLLGFLNGKG
jgi:hypothetical protein